MLMKTLSILILWSSHQYETIWNESRYVKIHYFMKWLPSSMYIKAYRINKLKYTVVMHLQVPIWSEICLTFLTKRLQDSWKTCIYLLSMCILVLSFMMEKLVIENRIFQIYHNCKVKRDEKGKYCIKLYM